MAAAITLAITGASGAPYALRLLELSLMSGRPVNLLVSKPGQIVLNMESGMTLSGQPGKMQAQLAQHFGLDNAGQLSVYGQDQWTAPIASGTGISESMVVCPCTTGTLAGIATGQSRNLIERAADVSIKEQKKLILVVRETPLSAIHLENMLKLARLGVIILPANPGFYFGVDSVNDLVDFVVARILDHLGITHNLTPTWGMENTGHESG